MEISKISRNSQFLGLPISCKIGYNNKFKAELVLKAEAVCIVVRLSSLDYAAGWIPNKEGYFIVIQNLVYLYFIVDGSF